MNVCCHRYREPNTQLIIGEVGFYDHSHHHQMFYVMTTHNTITIIVIIIVIVIVIIVIYADFFSSATIWSSMLKGDVCGLER